MRINTNINAMTALNQSTKNTALAGTSMGKLSSGERINKAGDDAAGLAISEKMRSQIRGLDQASKNAQDGISVVQTAEGATEEIGNIAQRMRELTIQAANETNSVEDREKITTELKQLHSEIDRIAESTEFNGKTLLKGTEVTGTKVDASIDSKKATVTVKGEFTGDKLGQATLDVDDTSGEVKLTLADGTTALTGVIDSEGKNITFKDGSNEINIELGKPLENGGTLTDNDKSTLEGLLQGANINVYEGTVQDKNLSLDLQIGANTGDGQNLEVKIDNLTTEALKISEADIEALSDTDIKGGTAAANALTDKLDEALKKINTSRSNLGATQNRLETAQSNLTTSSENLTAAESRIRDVDVAKEMMNLSKLNLLNQASQAMMMQAKSQPEGVMQLLR